MRLRLLCLLWLALPLATLRADDPLSLTLPSGKTLHFATQEQKARFEAARSRAAQPQPTATPTPTPTPATPMPATFPREVVLTRSVSLRERHGEYTIGETVIAVGTKLHVYAVNGLYLEVNGYVNMHYVVPLEWTDYMSRNVPKQPPASSEVRARMAELMIAQSTFY